MIRTTILRKITFALGGIAILFAVSCNEEKSPEKIAPVIEETTSTLTVNPEHGQPGHRCDIPVGMPLNSVPSQNVEKKVAPGPTTVSPIQLSQTPKVNPPHGELGHDCGIPVGSPSR